MHGASNDVVIKVIEAYYAAFPDSYFRDEIRKLESHKNKCINVHGDYTK